MEPEAEEIRQVPLCRLLLYITKANTTIGRSTASIQAMIIRGKYFFNLSEHLSDIQRSGFSPTLVQAEENVRRKQMDFHLCFLLII